MALTPLTMATWGLSSMMPHNIATLDGMKGIMTVIQSAAQHRLALCATT